MSNNQVISSQVDRKEKFFRLVRRSVSGKADNRNVGDASRGSEHASDSARKANTDPSTPQCTTSTTSTILRHHTFSGFSRTWTRENDVQNTPSTPGERSLKRQHTFSLSETVHKRICERQTDGNGEVMGKTTVKEVSVRRQTKKVYARRQ